MNAFCIRFGRGLGNGGLRFLTGQFRLGRDGHGNERAAVQGQPAPGGNQPGHGHWLIQAHVNRQAALARVEGGQFVCAVADDGHAVGFQHLTGGRQVED